MRLRNDDARRGRLTTGPDVKLIASAEGPASAGPSERTGIDEFLLFILIANRGEIAIRIARAAADLGIHTVSIFSPDDASSLHVRTTDKAYALPGRGPAAYLDRAAILRAAKEQAATLFTPVMAF